VYGLTKPLKSWNPFWANFHVWAELAHDAWLAPYWFDKLRIWFMPLGWTPRGMEPKPRAQPITPQTQVKYHTRLPAGLNAYVLAQFVVALALGTGVTLLAEERPLSSLVGPALLVFWSLAMFGGIFERRRWAFFLEIARLAAFIPILMVLDARGEWRNAILIVGGLWSMASLAWLVYYRREFTGQASLSGPKADSIPLTPTSNLDGSPSHAERVGVS
jgi:hypothetical protein